MFVGVLFETHSGAQVDLPPESVIGRMSTAGFRIDDPRISEAHALVSLRGTELRLLALRGRVSVDGKPATDIKLTPGLRIILAGFYPLLVRAVSLPATFPAIIGADDATPFPALGIVAFFPGTPVPLRHGFDPTAAAHLWVADDGITFRPNEPLTLEDPAPTQDRILAIGDRFTVTGHTYTLTTTDLSTLGIDATVDTGHLDAALTVHLRYDTARIVGAHGRTCTLDGLRARTLAELHAIGQPIAWQELTRILWEPNDLQTESQMRQRWDQLLIRIRTKLRESGIRSDLVRSVRPGLVELVLGPDDRVIDES